MNKLEYTLNALAWTLAGVFITLTYQRIANWYAKRNGRRELPPISSMAYFGSALIILSFVTTLFSYSSKIASDRNKDCTIRVNQYNSAVANERVRRQGLINDSSLNLAKSELASLKAHGASGEVVRAIESSLTSYIKNNKSYKEYEVTHKSIPIANCHDGKTPPGVIDPSTPPAPTGSPSTPAAPSKTSK